MKTELKIGTLLYRVNRDDRRNLEKHNFFISEILGLYKVEDKFLVFLGHFPSTPLSGIMKDIERIGYHIYRNETVLYEDNLEDVVKRLNFINPGANFYINVKDAAPEIKDLIKSEMEDKMRRIKNLEEDVKNMKKEIKDGL